MDCTKSNEKKIYVSNIPKQVDSKQLQKYFETFGSVYSAVVIGAKKGKSLSYGFVSFSSKKSLDKALAATHVIDGCQLVVDTVSVEKAKMNLVKYAQGGDPNVFLFIQDIPKDVNRQAFIQHFSKFGELSRVRLVSRPDKNKDFVYLQYKDIDAAAVAKSQKHRIPGLSHENITLVCKVGIFRNQKQVQAMEEAEDILLASRSGTDVIAFSESDANESDGRPTGTVVIGLHDLQFPTRNTAPMEPIEDGSDDDSPAMSEAEDTTFPENLLLKPIQYFSKCYIDEDKDNYRFNRATEYFNHYRSEERAREVLRHFHLTNEDIQNIMEDSSSGLELNSPPTPVTPLNEPVRGTVGAIGSERSNHFAVKNQVCVPKPKKKKSTFSGFKKALRNFGAALKNSFI